MHLISSDKLTRSVEGAAYVPISPQWNGLIPPVVQLYTRAALGLWGGGEQEKVFQLSGVGVIARPELTCGRPCTSPLPG